MSRGDDARAAGAELLSELAHDLRNFLEGLEQTVLSRPEIAADSDAGDVVRREVLALILKTERHGDDATRASGTRPARLERVELLPLCETTARSLAAFLRKRAVTLDVPESVAVSADRASFSRALAQACYSVCRSTADTSPVRFVASVASRDGENGRVSLVVEGEDCLDVDEGGPPRLVELDVYDRVLRRGKGSLVYERDGSHLRVTLRAPLHTSRTGSQGDVTRRGASNVASGSRVLVVDDNEDAARSLAVLLEIEGCQTEVRLDGGSALEAARAEPPAVVLLDLGLPDVDGFEVCRRLRERESTKGARIVAVSGFGDEDSRHRMDDAGFDDHLLKPVNPADLRRVLGAAKPG